MSAPLSPLSTARARLQKCRDRIAGLEAELAAERVMRDAAIVELYEAREKVDSIAADAGVTRSRVIRIVAEH